MKKIRILIADDHAVVRDGLQSLLSGAEDLEVVGQAASGLEAVQQARDLAPDVIVMDVAMPQLNGLEATRRILKHNPAARVLILSQYDEKESILAAVDAGAAGYLLKRAAGADLTAGIRTVHSGGAALDPAAAQVLVEAYRRCQCRPRGDSLEGLTDREREILILVAEGYTNVQIAELLHVSPKTVDGHRTSLMAKLDLHDRTQVVKYALRKQLIEL